MLTKRQKQTLDFIKSYIKKNGLAPSLEEIKTHLKLSSVSTAHHHVKALEDLGYLQKEDNQPRAIDIFENDPMIQVPLLGKIAAGMPIEAVEQRESIAVSKTRLPKIGDFYALKVQGDSMIDENINDGDVVIVKNQSTADNGQKVVALIDNSDVTLKKVFQENGKIRLQPANQNMLPIFVDADRLAIQGIVVDIIKSPENQIALKQFNKSNNDIGKEYSLDKNKIINQDCIEGLKHITPNSIDACITDPPYNYEFIGHKWDADEIKRRTERIQNSSTLVKHIPYGSGLAGGVRNQRWYKRNADNIQEYQDWCFRWGKEAFRVLKPGAYIMVFNSTRTVAHVQVALEKAGFYARDILVWKKNSGIPKGLNFTKKLEKEGVTGAEKWMGWHSCLRNEWEAIALLQKPLENNYLETVKKYDIGLMKAQREDGSFLSNILDDIKRDAKEEFNIHCTVKPLDLIHRLIRLVVPSGEDKVVLDPFMGSGTTAIAAIQNNTSFVGYEINKEYCEIAQKRAEKYFKTQNNKLF